MAKKVIRVLHVSIEKYYATLDSAAGITCKSLDVFKISPIDFENVLQKQYQALNIDFCVVNNQLQWSDDSKQQIAELWRPSVDPQGESFSKREIMLSMGETVASVCKDFAIRLANEADTAFLQIQHVDLNDRSSLPSQHIELNYGDSLLGWLGLKPETVDYDTEVALQSAQSTKATQDSQFSFWLKVAACGFAVASLGALGFQFLRASDLFVSEARAEPDRDEPVSSNYANQTLAISGNVSLNYDAVTSVQNGFPCNVELALSGDLTCNFALKNNGLISFCTGLASHNSSKVVTNFLRHLNIETGQSVESKHFTANETLSTEFQYLSTTVSLSDSPSHDHLAVVPGIYVGPGNKNTQLQTFQYNSSAIWTTGTTWLQQSIAGCDLFYHGASQASFQGGSPVILGHKTCAAQANLTFTPLNFESPSNFTLDNVYQKNITAILAGKAFSGEMADFYPPSSISFGKLVDTETDAYALQYADYNATGIGNIHTYSQLGVNLYPAISSVPKQVASSNNYLLYTIEKNENGARPQIIVLEKVGDQFVTKSTTLSCYRMDQVPEVPLLELAYDSSSQSRYYLGFGRGGGVHPNKFWFDLFKLNATQGVTSLSCAGLSHDNFGYHSPASTFWTYVPTRNHVYMPTSSSLGCGNFILRTYLYSQEVSLLVKSAQSGEKFAPYESYNSAGLLPSGHELRLRSEHEHPFSSISHPESCSFVTISDTEVLLPGIIDSEAAMYCIKNFMTMTTAKASGLVSYKVSYGPNGETPVSIATIYVDVSAKAQNTNTGKSNEIYKVIGYASTAFSCISLLAGYYYRTQKIRSYRDSAYYSKSPAAEFAFLLSMSRVESLSGPIGFSYVQIFQSFLMFFKNVIENTSEIALYADRAQSIQAVQLESQIKALDPDASKLSFFFIGGEEDIKPTATLLAAMAIVFEPLLHEKKRHHQFYKAFTEYDKKPKLSELIEYISEEVDLSGRHTKRARLELVQDVIRTAVDPEQQAAIRETKNILLRAREQADSEATKAFTRASVEFEAEASRRPQQSRLSKVLGVFRQSSRDGLAEPLNPVASEEEVHSLEIAL